MSEVLKHKETPEHFKVHHEENGEIVICMPVNGECSVVVQILNEYTDEDRDQLVTSVERALTAVDEFLGGKATVIFKDLHITIGEDLAEGGGDALSQENMIRLNGSKMLLTLAQMRDVSESYDPDELTGGPIDENSRGGALEYTLPHEMGHILDYSTEGNSGHRVDATESPTRYGREPDHYHAVKDHEAFAEGFAHMVYDMPVTDTMAVVIRQTIERKLLTTNL